MRAGHTLPQRPGSGRTSTRPIDELRKFADAALGESSPLFLSRIISAVVTLWLPLVLVRLLSLDDFGGYKQFFLVAQTALLIGQLGITQSLYYFLPRGRGGSYLSQAVLALSALGLGIGAALFVSAPLLGQWLVSPTLVQARAPLAVCVCAMLASAPLEIALIGERRVTSAAVVSSVSDAARAVILIVVAAVGREQSIYWAAAAIAWLRVGVLGALLSRSVLTVTRPEWAAWRSQLGFAVPFAVSGLFAVMQRYFAQYAVSSSFDPATFALFTVASFHLFAVDIVFNPIADMLTVRLSRVLGAASPDSAHARHAAALDEWHRAVTRLAILLVPLAAASVALSQTLIPLLFTDAYASAVPLFALMSLQIPLFVLPAESLLWAAGDTGYLLRVSSARSIVAVVSVLAGIHWLGLPGAIVGSTVADIFGRVALLARGRSVLEVQLRAIVDWPVLVRICLIAAVAAIVASWSSRLPTTEALQLAGGALIYGLTYGALLVVVHRHRPLLLRSAS